MKKPSHHKGPGRPEHEESAAAHDTWTPSPGDGQDATNENLGAGESAASPEPLAGDGTDAARTELE